ncbi:S8 family serine peptidase [Streptomyces sp. PmtG]
MAAVLSGTLLTGAAAAADTGTRQEGAAAAGAENGRGDRGDRAGKTATVTLITGDRVVVAAGGHKVVRLVRGKGRERVTISVRREAGHVFVVPQDAQALITAGRLDRRLFDVTQLIKDKYDDAHRASLPLIVGYRTGKTDGFRAADTFKGHARDRRALPAVGGEAFATPKSDATGLWSALTRGTGGRDGVRATAAPAVAHVWLDAKVRPTLDKSVPQIGAPTMWQAGYTGKGIKVAVLDTGIDQTHPDLKGVEVIEKNFTAARDAKDRMGHGTHVASTLAGSGAKSGGAYKGVAPGVRIMDGKVISEDVGAGYESDITAGMQWAVDKGAKIVNMSLGSLDTAGTEPMEEAVARLSGKALFVASAGNEGPDAGTLTTPGSAPAALTVGSVDERDEIAETSSRGPTADGVAKPDLTAPGENDITAAASTHGPAAADGYVAMSGTSMAAPHVAGSAALLLQQHPTWTGPQLKAALTGSAKPNPTLNPLQQGAGRVDLTRAVTASVVSQPGTLGFGTQAWPHTDDKPVGKTVTYRNHGTKPVTLALSTTAVDPAGRPGPAALFTVKDTKLTVPAGGTAKTTVTVNTRLGTADGTYGGSLLAAGDGQSVRTGLVVEREVESYDLTFRHLDVSGDSASTYVTTLTDPATQKKLLVPYSHGKATLRVPKGTYALESSVYGPGGDLTVFVQPKLKVGAPKSFTLDSRKSKPFAVTTPDRTARLAEANVSYEDQAAGISGDWNLTGGTAIRTAGLGPDSPTFHAQYNGVWKVPGATKKVDYRLAFSRTGTWFTGLKHATTKAELAEVKLGVGASVARRKGTLSALPIGANDYTPVVQPQTKLNLPASATSYVTTKGVRWSWSMAQLDDAGAPGIGYGTDAVAYKPGKRYTLNFNTGVVGPDLKADSRQGARRAGNSMDAYVQLFSDGAGHAGESPTTGGFTRIESGGRVLAKGGPGAVNAELPAASAPYRLTMEASRAAKHTATSTKVAVAWTFTSAKTPDEPPTDLPLSTVRLAPKLALSGTAPAGGTLTVPLKVAGAAAGKGKVAKLTVKVSYDGGRTWKPAPVTTDAKGAHAATVRHPATAKAVSYQVSLKDTAGNTMTETITNAYRLVP